MVEKISEKQKNTLWAAAISVAVGFLYATVLAKLGRDWWFDENYSHGLLVPFVIGMIVWQEWDDLRSLASGPSVWVGSAVVMAAFFLLFAGTLGAELFTTRISFVLMLAGIVVYLYGIRVINHLLVPFVLLVLSIPIPQIVFNRIAFPLQIWASQMAVWGIRVFDVPTLRNGNVIDILPRGSTQTISLEVVEACSGIRSLMTLVTLALILSYFTRNDPRGRIGNLSVPDLSRALILMVLAVPIAVLTNAARVTATGVLTYYYGKQATESTWHDISGWLVYLVALALLIGANYLLRKIFRGGGVDESTAIDPLPAGRRSPVIPLIAAIVIGGAAVNWFVNRGEAPIARRSLTELSTTLGEWRQKGDEIKFDERIESVLRTTDYTMREYILPDGRIANLYVGYYASQRTGSTYHSPQNCLPGAGWVMKDPQYIEIKRSDGTSFTANRYIIQNGIYNEVMIYWYQGRGRIEASEYTDKFNTIWDSVTRSRSDGSIVRIMTNVENDEAASVKAAADLSSRLADALGPFVPQ